MNRDAKSARIIVNTIRCLDPDGRGVRLRQIAAMLGVRTRQLVVIATAMRDQGILSDLHGRDCNRATLYFVADGDKALQPGKCSPRQRVSTKIVDPDVAMQGVVYEDDPRALRECGISGRRA